MARPPALSGFRPVFTVALLYFAALFVGYALVLILPEMLEAAAALPPGADPVAAGTPIAQQAAGGRLLEAFARAALTRGVGGYYQVLPGLRPPS